MNRTGFVCGAFDLLHPGHLYLLRECKNRCGYLVVGLHVNPQINRRHKNKPVQTIFERFYQLKNCKYVDQIIPYETEGDLTNILQTQEIDIRFLGTEYLDKRNKITGKEIVPIEYIRRYHTYSSSGLRERIKKA